MACGCSGSSSSSNSASIKRSQKHQSDVAQGLITCDLTLEYLNELKENEKVKNNVLWNATVKSQISVYYTQCNKYQSYIQDNIIPKL